MNMQNSVVDNGPESLGDRPPEKKSKPWYLMKLSSIVLALRPWSFSTSLMPVLLGCAISHKVTNDFNIVILIVTCLTAISVHAAGNVVNTYFDFFKGIDSKKSDDRTLVDQLLTSDEVVSLGAILYGLGCLGFIILVNMSPARMEHLALVYFGGLSSSFLYTGGIGLKYIALGDVLILIIFGPITALFSYMAQTGNVQWATIFYAIPLAMNTEAVLHSNNTRDLESDKKAGIVTLAIALGPTLSHLFFAILLFTPYVSLFVFSLHYSYWFLLPLLTLRRAFALEKEFRSANLREIPQRMAKVNVNFGLFYIVSFILSGSKYLPFL